MPEAQLIRSAVDLYVESFRRANKEQFLHLLADDVEQEDPVGAPRNLGKQALSEFFDTVFSLCDRVEFEARELYISGDEGALVFTIRQHRKDGSTVTLDGVDTFRIDPEGKVALVRGYAAPRS